MAHNELIRSTLFANSAIFVALKDRTQFQKSDKRSYNKASSYFTYFIYLVFFRVNFYVSEVMHL